MQTAEILLDVIKKLSQAGDMETVTLTVKTAARKLSGADGATFILKENELCYYIDEDAISPLWRGKRFAMESCISGWVMQNRKPAVVVDVFQDNRIPADVYQPTFVKSLVVVPIRSANPLGAIGIYWGRKYMASPEVVELLQSLADSTAVAIENIQVLSKYNETVEELKKQNYTHQLKVEELKKANLKLEAETSERKKAEEELLKAKTIAEKSEIRYRSVVSNSPVVSFVINPDGIFTLSEGKGLEKLGLKPGEVVGLSALELYKDYPVIINDIKKTLDGNVSRSETALPGVVYDILYNPVFDNKGNLIEVIGIANDITERKQAENEIEKHKLELEEYFENDVSADYLVSISGEIFSCNKTFLNLFGFEKKSETKKFNITGLYKNPEERKRIIRLVNKQGKVENHEVEFISRDGKTIYALINAIGIFGKENKLDKIRVYIVDITELKNIEKELRKLSRAVEQSPASVIVTDLNGKIEYVNPKILEITGYTKEELIGKNPRIFSSGEKSKSDYQHLWNTISSANEWFGEFHNKKKNGELYWESASISPILNEKQEIINYLAIKEDITERKKFIEDLKISKEKAEENDRLKSAFLANMSHEIRTPMNGILGFTQLLLEPDLSSEQKEAYIDIVNQSGKRMLNTVNDIIEISKIEVGIVTVNLKEVDIQERLDEILRFFNPEATKKGLKLTLENEVPKGVSFISTDQNKIDSILTNLIKNAIKFTQTGEIRVGCKVHENRLEFYVKDTGIGIPAERQQAVFERFTKADILDKDARQGSGLGLSITKAYVEMLGGEIRVESIVNQGSTFFFTLPLNKQVQEKTGKEENGNQEEKTSQRKGLDIIIAEDDETSALYLQTILQTVSSKIILTQNGNETVEACRNNHDIDLVLMDIQMPDMNGYEATRRIREFNKDVVIIAQTAFALAGDRKKSIDAGCNDYIAKPINKNELQKMIQKYFGN